MKNSTSLVLTSFILFAFLTTACGGEEVCTTDDDCGDGEICAQGECLAGENSGFDIGEENGDDCPQEGCLPPWLVTSTSLDFYFSQPGSPQWLPLEVRNAGESPLEIEDITIGSGQVFAVTFPRDGRDEDGFFPRPGNDSDNFSPTTVWPEGDPLLVRVWFHPEDLEPHSGTLEIHSNDPDQPEYVIELNANRMRACLTVDQVDGIDFQSAPTNEITTRTVSLRNCNVRRDVHLNSITISNSDGGSFSIDPDSYPGSLPGETHILPPMETTTVIVRYHPEQAGPNEGELFISSTDERNPQLRIPLLGQGVEGDCPQGAIGAAIDAPPTVSIQKMEASPLETVNLSVIDAEDPQGGQLSYEWSLITRPFASDARLSPSGNIIDPDLWLDLAGTYVVELTVRNDEGVGSCSPARLEIEARPDNDIYIQLNWYTQAIPEPEGGEGTDLDLHYVHPQGDWGSPQWAVWVDEQEQNWDDGVARMPIADAWGEFPEVVTHDNPVAGHLYAVGVHYNWDFLLGSSEASVRIFMNGLLMWEEFDRSLHEVDDLWFVGHIEWGDEPQFHLVDEMTGDHDLVGSEPPWW